EPMRAGDTGSVECTPRSSYSSPIFSAFQLRSANRREAWITSSAPVCTRCDKRQIAESLRIYAPVARSDPAWGQLGLPAGVVALATTRVAEAATPVVTKATSNRSVDQPLQPP